MALKHYALTHLTKIQFETIKYEHVKLSQSADREVMQNEIQNTYEQEYAASILLKILVYHVFYHVSC